MKRIFAIAVLLTVVSAWGQVATLEEQAQCSRQAQIVLKSASDYSSVFLNLDSNLTTVASHFDPVTGKCFAELGKDDSPASKYEESVIVIVNAFEGRRVANFDYFPKVNELENCSVAEESCLLKIGEKEVSPWAARERFDALVKKHGMR